MTRQTKRVLIVDDDAALRTQMKWAFENVEIFEAQDRKEAMVMVRRAEPDVVLLDLGLPPTPHETSEGFLTLEAIKSERPDTKIVVITGQDDRAVAREAVSRGAYDFFSKPTDLDEVRVIVMRAFSLIELEAENAKIAAQSGRTAIPGLITQSAVMTTLCRTVERVAATNVSVMLTGESGTGKELIARALHDLSPRAAKPFVAINCAAIPPQLLESELFGHEKGAFTGAYKQTGGKVEQADSGTLFLDEVGELDQSMQAKLLRFLQERRFERVGGRKTIEVDVRVVSATNRDLDAARRSGAFREDLFFRLNEISLVIPPLRERDQDAALLARHFIRAEARNLAVSPKKLSARAISAISSYSWPGNVRELQNRTKRALVLCTRDLLEPADFELSEDNNPPDELPTLREERHRTERKLIQRALAAANGNVSETARLLGISRPTLYELLRSLEIPIPST